MFFSFRKIWTPKHTLQEILQNLGLDGTLHHGTTLLNIANAYRAGGRLEDSLEKYKKVAEIYEELLEEDDIYCEHEETLCPSILSSIKILLQ